MLLKSTILSGNDRLERAAAGGPSVKPAPPAEDPEAVRRIQKALVFLLGVPMRSSFPTGPEGEPDGRYGNETCDFVIAFQKKVFPKDPAQWDGRVGKKTLEKMDELLPKGSSAPVTKTLQVIPFHESGPFLISNKDDSRTKGDLSSTPKLSIKHLPLLVQGHISLARRKSTADLERDVANELVSGSLIIGSSLIGKQMLDDFTGNSAALRVITHGVGSPLSKRIQRSKEFKDEHEQLKSYVTEVLKRSAATGILDYRELAESKKRIPAPDISFDGVSDLHILIGSIQGVSVFLTDFSASEVTRRYQATLSYELFDHFGVDDSDTIPDTKGHGSPGQVALWVLQRERRPGHMPYIPRIVIEERIEDDF
ncbi:MAG: hypothetical protein AB1898_15020 [Acidobacteriota bacterium]